MTRLGLRLLCAAGLLASALGCTPGPLRAVDIPPPFASRAEIDAAARGDLPSPFGRGDGGEGSPDLGAIAGGAVPLDALVDAALAQNPSLAAARAAWVAAKARVPQAASWDPPVISLAVEDAPFDGNPDRDGQNMIEVSQTIPFVPRLLAEGEAMAGEADMAEAEALDRALEVALDVAAMYYEVLYVRRSLEIIDEILDLVEGVVASAEARYTSGMATQAEMLAAQTERASLDVERIDLERMLANARVRLNAVLGREPGAPLGDPVPGLPEEALEVGRLVRRAVESSPRVLAARAAIRRDEGAVDAADYMLVPDLMARLTYSQVDGMPDMYDAMIGIDLPWLTPRTWWRRTEARATLASDRAALVAAERDAAAAVAEAVRNVESDRARLAIYGDTLIPRATDALHSAIAAYQTGRAMMELLLRSLTDLLDARRAEAQIQSELGTHWAELERAVGRPAAEW